MDDKLFRKILIILTIIGSVSVIALMIYTLYLHENCSIISYIANRG